MAKIPLVIAWCMFLGWQMFSKVIMVGIYMAIISEGLRSMAPTMCIRLYKLPFLHFLKYYEATFRLDIAPFVAVCIGIVVFLIWERVVEAWLNGEFHGEWTDKAKLLACVGGVLLGADGILFYRSIVSMGWGGEVISFSALVCTVLYIAVVVGVSFLSFVLRSAVSVAKEASQ